MTPDGIREKFDLYRKWFRTILVKEFINLPTKYQNRFLAVADKFMKDCRKVYEEGKKIKEKTVRITVTEVLIPDNKEENYTVCGKTKSEPVKDLRMSFSPTKPYPKIGSRLSHIMFSSDGDIWYSSKEELIIGRRQP